MRSRDLGVHMHPLHPIWLRLWKAGPVWAPVRPNMLNLGVACL